MISRISKIFNKTDLTTNTKCFNLLVSQLPLTYAQSQQIGTIQSFRMLTTLADVRHDEVRRKIYLEIDQRTAYLRYTLNNGVLKIITVYVPKELEGKGLGGLLSKGAFKYVADNNLKMEILCVYAAHYLEKYAPQYKKYLV